MEGADIAMNYSSPAMNYSSPAISFVNRRVMATPVSAPLSGTAPHPSPDLVSAGGAPNGNLERTPVVINAQPLRYLAEA